MRTTLALPQEMLLRAEAALSPLHHTLPHPHHALRAMRVRRKRGYKLDSCAVVMIVVITILY